VVNVEHFTGVVREGREVWVCAPLPPPPLFHLSSVSEYSTTTAANMAMTGQLIQSEMTTCGQLIHTDQWPPSRYTQRQWRETSSDQKLCNNVI